MSDGKPDETDPVKGRRLALSRWENEGGAGPVGPQERWGFGDGDHAIPALTNAELVHLRIRVIALENVMLGLLSQCSERQLDLMREMASYIHPRPGFTQHPLTVHAATQMIHLVERAGSFRDDAAG